MLFWRNQVMIDVFGSDPAFPFEVNALMPIRRQGDFVDDKGVSHHFDAMVVQCTWGDVAGRTAICLARPVADYKPDLAKIVGPVRFAVTSASSKGGVLTLRFAGWESVAPRK